MTGLAYARPRGSLLDRTLRLFSDVRAGEGVTAVLLAVNVFLLLMAYSVIKPVRDALILTGGGAELKSYLSAGMVLVLLVAVPAYARLANRFPRRRLINTVTIFFAACLVVFYLLDKIHVPLGVAFFIWIGVFNMMIVAQFWSFANDVYTEDEGKRLFPIVAFGASSGAVFGALAASRFIADLGIGPCFVIGGILLLSSLLLTATVDKREHQRTESHLPTTSSSQSLPAASGVMRAAKPGEQEKKATGNTKEEPARAVPKGAFQLVFHTRYLLMIGLLMLLANWVNTTGQYILDKTLTKAAEEAVAAGATGGLSEREFIGTYSAQIMLGVNILGLLLQLFVVSRVIKYLGVRVALLALPVIALGGYAVLTFIPVLSAVRWAKTAENATDYSLQNTVRNVLFLPTTREEKYKAKQAIDTFFVRSGDVLSALLVLVGTSLLSLEARGFAAVNLTLAAIWVVLAVRLGREYQRVSGRNV